MPNLIQIVDAAVADAYRRGGHHLVCRPGCSQCCIGVFPISQQDAARLRDGLTQLILTDSARAQRIRDRVAASLARLAPHFPGNPVTGILSEDEELSEAFEDFANDEPCPVLDPATGTCDLYAHRPVLCRTFGPPARTDEGHLAHCELCFTQATPTEIAADELDPSLPELIAQDDIGFNTTHHIAGETLVAYALLDLQDSSPSPS